MSSWITSIIHDMSYAGVIWLAFVENVFPPIPSELIMPLAGYLAAQGAMTLTGVIAAGTLGSVLGALLLYALAWWIGERRLMTFADRHGRWLTLTRQDVERASAWFARHGIWAVFACRMIPGLRSLISIPAGLQHMNLAGFVVATAAGSLAWTALLVYAGYALGANFGQVVSYIGPLSDAVIAGIVVVYLWRVFHGKGKADDV
ncbi:MAG TPA: DedA family protein [Rhodanobacteraceae bacterium]|nr:DedA family protein [Rhodanobacteraceae bacterium]